MKYVLFLIPFLFACAPNCRPVQESDLEFNAGDSVVVTKGSYKGCKGYISGFSNFVDEKNPVVNYTISGVTCQGKKVGELTGSRGYQLASSNEKHKD